MCSKNTSIENVNDFLHVSVPPTIVVVPQKNLEKRSIEHRKPFREYRKTFRAKKVVFPTKNDICGTQKCIKEIVRIVSLAGNHCPGSQESDQRMKSSEIIEFDYNNPQKLDVQGVDQMQTYRKDEQDIQAKREYEIMKRELDRRRMTGVERGRYEQEVRDQRFKLPDLYNIDVNPVYEKNSVETIKTLSEEADISAEKVIEEVETEDSELEPDVLLFRTKDKPKNRVIIEAESDRRTKNLQNRLIQMWEKEKKAENERKIMEKTIKDELSFTIANEDFQKLYEEKKPEEIFIKPLDPAPPRQYPHTFKELKSFRRKLNREKRELRDKCVVREKLFQELNKQKFCQGKLLQAEDFSDDAASMSAQSSDGEDGLQMGYKNSEEFLVRGWHDKFSNEPRGKFLNQGKNRSVKTCLNRDEWIQSTFFECERKKTLRKVNYVTNDVTNENYDIFHRKWKYEKPKNVKSPVKEYIEKGNILEASTKTKNLKVKKPKYVKVKTFNLTDFLFGAQKGKKIFEGEQKLYGEIEAERKDLLEKLKQLEKEDEEQQQRLRKQRREYLGFLCRRKKYSKEKVVISDSDSDWLPNEEPMAKNAAIMSNIILKNEHIPLVVSNMRAPEHREPTLKRHPRRLRQKSVAEMNENDSRAPLNVARLQKLDFDLVKQTNLEEKKDEISEYFKNRRHHDHLDHTQQKMVRVKYIPKMQKFKETLNVVVDTANKVQTNIQKEETVQFPLKSEDAKIDWSRYCPEETSNEKLNQNISKIKSEELISLTKIDPTTPIAPEKSRFTEFIQTKYQQNLPVASGTIETTTYEYPEAQNYRQQLLEEQISAASCLSSASSSLCTNFTNDSGSFFIITDKKVPLDYLMKHQVPFEALTENHRQANLIEKEDEYHAPYLTVANAGQQIEMREMCVPKDKFYTQVTRDRAGIRSRLKVDKVKLEEQLIGFNDEKFKPRFG